MKKVFVFVLFIVFTNQILFAQVDRSKIPAAGPAPIVSFPDYDLVTLKNGLRVILVEDKELPTIAVSFLIDRKPHLEGEYAGCIGLMGQLLRNGTKKRTKDQLDNEIDLIGANISSSSTSLFASGLSKYKEKLLELSADILLNPSFPQDELDKLKEQTISGLKYRKTEPNAIVEILRKRVLYRKEHPYGEFETEESIEKISREKCIEMYNTFFKPNYAIISIVGDFEKKSILKLIEKYFGNWEKGEIPQPKYDTPKLPDKTNIALVDRPSSVQSVINVSQVVDLKRTSPDVIPVEVMNTILGGGIFRLFINLREKHSYTYGAYSTMGPDELIGNFTASTSVRNAVTDSSLEQIFFELNRIRDEKVEPSELQMAKNYLSGSFVRNLENAETIANYAIDIERFKLPKDYYKNYLKKVEAVTIDDVMRVAQKYLDPTKMTIAIVGSAKEIKDKITKFGSVKLYDEDINEIIEKTSSSISITPDELFAKYIEKSGGKEKLNSVKDRTIQMSGKIQNFNITAKTIHKAPNKLYIEIDVGGMFKQKIGFDGEKGWMVGPQGTMDLTGERLIELEAQALMNFYQQYKELNITANITGIKNIKGKDYYEVVFNADTLSSWTEYFGVDDYLKFRQIKTGEGPSGKVEQTTDYFDYKDYNGFLFSSKQVQTVMGQEIEMKVDKFEINTNVDDSIFVKPNK